MQQKVQFAWPQQASPKSENVAITTLDVKIVGGFFLCIHRLTQYVDGYE
jgi:hypothetical protein